jgi:hypothetical protein
MTLLYARLPDFVTILKNLPVLISRHLRQYHDVADMKFMINIFPTRANKTCLLVSSDQQSRAQARREIAQWAAERDLELPRRPRRLSLVEDNRVVAEWVVIEKMNQPEPPPPSFAARACGHLTLIPGGRAA